MSGLYLECSGRGGVTGEQGVCITYNILTDVKAGVPQPQGSYALLS